MLLRLVSVFFLVCSVNTQYRFDCDENYCTLNKINCPALNCEEGRIVKHATTCGCCDICIKNLKEGKECLTSYYGSLNLEECGPKLVCKQKEGIRGVCAPSKCLETARKYEKDYAEGKYRLKISFGCDHFGNFEPVVCIDHVLCFCVDKNGKRIFGTDVASNNDTMSCDCSRDIHDFPKEVEAEKLPRCLPNGNYDPLQCVEDECYCMDPRDDDSIDISEMEKLSCYDGDRHKNKRKTDCLEKRKFFLTENLTIIAVDRPHCDLDGTYSPIQCNGGRCSCTSKIGEKVLEPENEEDALMTCRCLRDKEVMLNSEDYTGQTSYVKDFQEINCDNINDESNKNIISESFFKDFYGKYE